MRYQQTNEAARIVSSAPVRMRRLPRMLRALCLYCMLCFGILLAAGCAGKSAATTTPDGEEIVAVSVPYNEVCLHHYQLAQYYAVAGRYEVALEFYLLALASAENPQLRSILASQLDGVEKMIYSTR